MIPSPRAARLAFWPYALLIFLLTHWPGVKVDLPIHRPDILVHIAVFFLWTILCTACGFFGPALSTRNILIAGAVSLVYSIVDETLQLIPFLNRVAAVDDALANAAGVALAVAAALLTARILRDRAARRQPPAE